MSVVVGANIGRPEILELIAEVTAALIDDQPRKVCQSIAYSGRPVEGTYHGPGFQIIPIPPEQRRASSICRRHPFILEVPYVSTRNLFVSLSRQWRAVTSLSRLLNLFTGDSVCLPPDYLTAFDWVGSVEPGEVTYTWQMLGYRYPGLASDLSDFSPCEGLPCIPTVPLGQQDPEDASAPNAFTIPKHLALLFANARGLRDPQATKFARSITWFSKADAIVAGCQSSAYIAMVSAIEALLPEVSDRCDKCHQPVHALTKRFKEFLATYLQGIDQSDVGLTILRETYRRRSDLAHGSSLLQSDIAPLRFNQTGSEEREQYRHL